MITVLQKKTLLLEKEGDNLKACSIIQFNFQIIMQVSKKFLTKSMFIQSSLFAKCLQNIIGNLNFHSISQLGYLRFYMLLKFYKGRQEAKKYNIINDA